jgi:ATP-binding cassette subfamily B protein
MSKSQTKQTIKVFWKHAWTYPGLVIGTLFAIPLTTLINNFLPPLIAANVLNKLATGDFVQDDLVASFGPQLALYAIILVTGVFAWRFVDFFAWRLEARVQRDLAIHMYNHLLNLDANFHANNFSGSLVSQNNKVLGAYVRISDTTIYGTLPMIWGIIFTSVLLANRAPLFVVGLNTIVVIFVVTAIKITGNTRVASADYSAQETAQTGVLADSITNVLSIKSYSAQNYEERRFKKYTNKTERAFFKLLKFIAIQITSFALFTRVIQITSLIAGAVSVIYFDASIATVFLVLTYSSTIADQLFNFSNSSLRNYNRAFGDASQMTENLDLTPTILDPENPQKFTSVSGRINFTNVSFTHDGSKSSLFKDFSLHIKPGEKVGLVGHLGSGKTTLTRLLLRYSDVNAGVISLDNIDIRSVKQDDLHSKITYVPQEPLLFHRSLAENIAYGNPNAKQQEIQAVAKMAHAHEFIKELPEGYSTLVGERGVKLSGGQRQRVAIARAMLKNAPILVLDEATSALDSESEALIQDALWKLMNGKTAIAIAHRLSTIQKMDRIIVLDNGKIIEEGSHKELIRKGGKYAELWDRQSGGFIED